jgi:hypothetical protein
MEYLILVLYLVIGILISLFVLTRWYKEFGYITLGQLSFCFVVIMIWPLIFLIGGLLEILENEKRLFEKKK